MFSILVISDNNETQKLISLYLQHKGYSVFPVSNCEQVFSYLENHYINLILLDRSPSLRGADDFMETNKNIGCDIPPIVISESSDLSDLKTAYKNGADDYMVKPINHHELNLRIQAILRRSMQTYKKIIVAGKSTLYYDSLLISFPVNKKIQNIFLPKKEFYILFLLLNYPNRIFTRQQIMNEIWDFDSESKENTVDVHINRLRKKLKNIEDFKIITVKNIGYKAILTK